jgi:acyl-CoA synthetase (AMP-forming)/AMP-acid ligase II
MQSRYSDILAYNGTYFPDNVAVTLDERALTYSGLATQVREAHRLLAQHVAAGDRVAIWLPNSFAWIATFLALTSLRAVSVPINTRLTIAELDVILRDANVRVLVTTAHYRGRNYFDEANSGDLSCPIMIEASDDLAAEDWRVQARASASRPGEPAERDDLFCIQYTSGTTSKPKGVMLTEQMYLRTAAHCARCQVLTPGTSFMSAAPFFHCSGSMHAITVCLLAGCTLHTMSVWDVERFLHLAQMYRLEVGHGVYLRDVVAHGIDKARPYLTTLKTVNTVGTPKDLRVLHDELGVAGIANLYGMTETCGNITMWYPDDPLIKRISWNGRPQVGNSIRIADLQTGTDCAPDQVGEIQMKGPTVTPGYFRRPEATATAFTADGWFRSGDLGSLNDEGELHYIARVKEIVRVGGENVSPAEVEEVLRDVSGLKQVCVLAVPHERLGEVAAAVVIADGEVAWPAVLLEVKNRLANFKVPREIYVTDAFPMTATNKVQRSVLQKQIADGKFTRVS